MVGDSVFVGAKEILEGVDVSLIVVLARCHVVGGEKSKARANVWASARGKPVDTSDDALIDFGAAFQIRIVVIRVWDGVDRNA